MWDERAQEGGCPGRKELIYVKSDGWVGLGWAGVDVVKGIIYGICHLSDRNGNGRRNRLFVRTD